MALTDTGSVDLPWERCSEPGCKGAQARPEACIAHLDEAAQASVLAGLGRSGSLDARGVVVDAPLLAKILAACPKDGSGRPVLKQGRFDRATFATGAVFEGVLFTKGVSFDGTRFNADASFSSSRFQGPARFAGASFTGPASFDETTFDAQAWFGGATFCSTASFGRAEFSNLAWFGQSRFQSDAAFDEATFRGNTNFDGADFGGQLRFTRTGFHGETRLDRATFNHEPRYDEATFTGRGGAPEAAVRQAVWKGAPLAPWRARVGAAIVDLALAAVPVVVSGLLGVIFEGPLHYNGALVVIPFLGVCASLAFNVYNVVDQGRTGQTIGKRRMGIRLLRERDGLPTGVPRSLGRQALHVLDTLPAGIGWLRPLWNAKRQTIADTLVTTVVVESSGGK